MGDDLGKSFNSWPTSKEGWSLANRYFLCLSHEESIDHILLHCGKARVLWELLFFLFKVYWAMQSTIREILLGWYGSFVGRKRKKVWKKTPLCLFWTIWKERNRTSFENVKLSIQRLKFLFLCNLLTWTKMFISERLMSIVDFIDWLGSVWGRD